MITQEQISKFNTIYETEGRVVADAYAQEIISDLELETPKQRGDIWDIFRAKMRADSEAKRLEKEKADRKAKTEARKNKASIKSVCEVIIKQGSRSDYETKFLNDIKTKRKLTERQESWLRALAEKSNIEIKGGFESKKSHNVTHCQHEDLGSLGYTHGTTVRCPNCGSMAEVW